MSLTKNYHTHTYRCKHATGDVPDYCQAAVEQGLTVLGISDHAALPDDRWPGVRMSMLELPEYCGAIDAARQAFPTLTLLKGMECEFAPEYASHLEDTLLGGAGDEMQTKLDLAQAYVDMGDVDGARALLDEVAAGGDDAQKRSAAEMIGKLG